MPIYKGEDKTENAYKGSIQLARIYKGDALVYENYKTLTAEGIPPITLSNCKNTDMLGYKVYGNSKQQSLPDGYTQLEYIESTGTQYIDLGIKPKNASFELTMSNPSSTVTSGTYIAGVYSTPKIALYFVETTDSYIKTNVNGATNTSIQLTSAVAIAKYDPPAGWRTRS